MITDYRQEEEKSVHMLQRGEIMVRLKKKEREKEDLQHPTSPVKSTGIEGRDERILRNRR
jgi:hypothetical protein